MPIADGQHDLAFADNTSRSQGVVPGEFWLDGSVILCACPDCRAPMSVRLWLMIADCWRCGTCIELSEEHQREIERLLAEREHRPPPPPSQPEPNVVPDRSASVPLTAELPATSEEFVACVAEQTSETLVQCPRWLRRALDVTPAWLVSMLVHMSLLAILALLTMKEETGEGPFITLSSTLSRQVREGEDTFRIPPDVLAQFDLPLPSKAELADSRKREALLAAAQDARELRLDERTPNLPELAAVKERVGRADGYASAVAARDPRLRVEMVTQEGGTTLTEAAVARGLRWLARHQNADGSWSLSGFRHAADCNCSGDGYFRTRSPGTALALLPFLGAGQTHLAGKYQGAVSRGLRWLIDNQSEDGDLRAGANGSEGMYAHGQAAIVLCEAFAMTGDEALRGPAQRAVDFIVAAQYHDGGWRYRPAPRNQRGDTSVVGWQLMALQSARSANLSVPDETFELADLFLDSVESQRGALYAYQAGNKPTHTMTAEALLCRMYLGWAKDRPGLVRGVAWLSEEHEPALSRANIYYWYYATQVLHHYGGRQWEEWNLRMRDVLVKSQETRGHAAGSWAPRGEHASSGGRIYMTALAVCTLEVYYRHLPIFRQIELGN